MRKKKLAKNWTQKRRAELDAYVKEKEAFDRLVETYASLNLFKTEDRKRDYIWQFQPKLPRWFDTKDPKFTRTLQELLKI